MTNTANRLDEFLKAKLDNYIQETAQLCAQPSISASNEGVLECIELVIEILERHGFQVQKFETRGNPIAEAVYQRPYLINPLAGGSTPIYAFADPLGGIPIIMAGVDYANNRTHSPDEHVRLADFLNTSRHIANIVDGFADLSDSSATITTP